MVQRAAGLDRHAVPVRIGLRLLAKALLLITAIAAMGVLQQHRWTLGGLGAFVVAILLTFVAVLVHELAHAGAARWVGADVLKIVALPFELRLRPRRLRFIGTAGHGDIGGYVAYHLDRIDAHRRHAIIAAAGPLANIATGILAGVAAAMLDAVRRGAEVAMTAGDGNFIALPDDNATRAWIEAQAIHVSYGEPIAPVLAAAFMLVSLGMGLANLIPYDQSDGMHLWRYFRRLKR